MKFRRVVLGYCRLVLGLSLLASSALAHAGSAPALLPNPNPNAQDNYYGNAVTLSPDGSIAVVAAIAGGYLNTTPPAVYVFQYANGVWNNTPIISICDPAANAGCTSDSEPTDLFASSVSVSSININTFLLIVGSPGGGKVNGSPVTYGVVYVYQCTVSPAACGTPVATISDPSTSPSASDNFGSAAAISQDGNTVLVGAWGTPEPGGSGVGNQIEPNVGSAYVYTTSGDVWPATPTVTATLSEYGVTCAPFGSSIVCDKFGYAVALSADGTAAIVGAPGVVDNGNPGEGNAYAFGVVSGAWQDLPETTLYNSDGTSCTDVVTNSCDEYGSAVAISADGSTALVGAPNALAAGAAAGEFGLVSLFHQLVPGTWAGVTSPTIIYSNPNQNQNTVYTGIGGFGTSLALSNDGTTVLVGLPEGAEGTNDGGYGGSGEMDSYTCNFSSSPPCVNTPGQVFVDPVVLVNPGASFEPPDFFGAAVAISNGADVLLAGAPDSNLYGANDNGAAYVYGVPSPPHQVALTFSFTGPNNTSVAAGQNLVYSLIVTNTDKSVSATNVTLTGTLAAGVTLVSDSTDNGSCSVSGSNYSCTLSSLGPGASWIPTLTLQISSAEVGQTVVVASASVKAGNSSNNPAITASVTVSISTSSLSMYYIPFFSGWTAAATVGPSCQGPNDTQCIFTSAVVCTNAPGSVCLMLIVIFNNSKTQTADNVSLAVTIPPGTTISSIALSSPGLCFIDPVQAKMGCGLGSLAPSTDWAVSFVLNINSNAQIGQSETSQATVSTSNAGSSNAAYNVGTPYTVSGSGIGWLELAALGGLLWFAQGRKKWMQRF